MVNGEVPSGLSRGGFREGAWFLVNSEWSIVNNSGRSAQSTVALPPHQGPLRKPLSLLSDGFFGYFFSAKKVTES
jgi:hypothetical protein